MKIVVVGGGASGMMAALISAKEGAQVTLIEKNEKTGKKLYITGKGRCNLLNLCSKTEFLDNVVTNSKFLFSAIHKFSPQDAYSFFEEMLPLKVERGNRVFPKSDKKPATTAPCAEPSEPTTADVPSSRKPTNAHPPPSPLADRRSLACRRNRQIATSLCHKTKRYEPNNSAHTVYNIGKNLSPVSLRASIAILTQRI